MEAQEQFKTGFKQKLSEFVETLENQITTPDGQWTVKGFIDVFRNLYTISPDTKIVSKILEIHLFPKLLKFAVANNYRVVLAGQQNYYPDMSLLYRGKDPNLANSTPRKPSRKKVRGQQ